MPVSPAISNLALRVATETKAIRTLVNGNTADLSSLTTTAKGNLVLAINEVNAKSPNQGTETAAGILELATAAETTLGTDNTRAVHPAGLKVELDKKANTSAFAATAFSTDAANLTGTLPSSVLPPLAINDTFVVASQAAMLALTAQRGDIAKRTDTSKTYVLAADAPATLANWVEITSTGDVISVAGRTGAVVLTKTDVGLANVDNTADTAKPVSTAQQTALNGKENTVTAGTTAQYYRGDKTWATHDKASVGLANVDNTADTAKPVSTAQQTALNAKENTVTAGTTAQYYRGDKTWVVLDKTAVGLANVDNTSDAAKPVSTATQTALNAKEGTITAGTTAQYWRGDKTWVALDKTAVGLGNVDNTSDVNKPVSSATQTALNGKAATVHTHTLADLPSAWVKMSVRAATTANITLSAPQTVDTIALVAGDRVLVKNQTTASQNGIYVVAAAAWTRAADADTSAEIAGGTVNVDLGTQAGKLFSTTFTPSNTMGTTSMLWYEVYTSGSTIPVAAHVHPTSEITGLDTALAGKQPLDPDLTAIGNLASAANQLPYATGVGTWALTSLTVFARTLLDDADALSARTTLDVYSKADIGNPDTDYVAVFESGLV